MHIKYSKILIAILLIVLVIGVFPSLSVYADEGIQLNGEGTIDNPYQIWDKEDLLYFSESVNSGETYYKQYVVLMNDIDMQNTDMHPIGEFGLGSYFLGTFDGNGHVIKNISIVSESNAGLFGQLGGTVMNLGIESGSIYGEGCCGAIASHSISKYSLIINCYNKAHVYGKYRAGGIVDNFSGTILNCWSDCELDANSSAFGIVSYSCSSMNFCYSSVEIKPGTVDSKLSVSEVSSDTLYSQIMADILNENLSNNLNYELKSRIDATKLNCWKFENGNLCFSDQKASVSREIRLKPVIQQLEFFILLIIVFSCFVLYFKIPKRITIDRNSKSVVLSCAFIVSSFIAFICCVVINRGYIFNQLFFYAGSDTFMDYYNSVYDAASRHPYENYVIYPPLCNLIYYVSSRFISEKYFSGIYHFPGGSTIRDFQGIKLSFALYNFVIIATLLISISKIFKEKSKLVKILATCAVMFSMPFLYSFERGNIILLSFAFLLVFVATYNSDSKTMREIGLISLAIGGVIKIYPALIGIILLEDKRIKEALRTILYGVLFFFLPFAIFGGIDGFRLFLRNISGFAGGSGSISLYTFNMNPGGLFSYISEMTGLDFEHTKLFSLAIGVILLLISFFESVRWKKICMIICSMICIMPTVGTYGMIYMLVPWIIMIRDNAVNDRKMNRLFSFLFILLFSTIPMGLFLRTKFYESGYIGRISAGVHTLVITTFAFVLIVEFIYHHLSRKKSFVIYCVLLFAICVFIPISIYSARGIPINNGIEIDLSVSNSNNNIILSGIGNCEDGYTWTTKGNMLFNYLETEPGKDYYLILNVHDTYCNDTISQEIVVYDDKEEIYRGFAQGESVVRIPIHSDSDKLKLRIELPNAKNPYYVEHIEDRRSLALQLESIEIQSCL